MTSDATEPVEAPRAGRRWSRTTETRAGILAAARAVFMEHGFTNANISDVVDKSGSSVGSIYHHFGGKTELYSALCSEYHDTLHEASTSAVRAARAAGERDPMQLFIAGARGYLERVWVDQDLARVVLSDDHPPGHATWQMERNREWARANGLLLGLSDGVESRVLVMALTTIVGEGARLVSELDSRREALEVIDATLDLIRKLG